MDGLFRRASIVFKIEGSVGTATVIMTVPDIATLNECYSMLRYSATFEDAFLIVTRDDGMNVVNRGEEGCPPFWWVGIGLDESTYVQLLRRR